MSSQSPARRGRRRVRVDEDSEGPQSQDAPVAPASGEETPQETPVVDEIERDLFADDDEQPQEEDDGEDLFGDRMERDYEERPELDFYDPEHLDEDAVSEMSMGERMEAEREMAKRDVEEGRDPGGMGDFHLYGREPDSDTGAPTHRRRRMDKGMEQEEEEFEPALDLLSNIREGFSMPQHCAQEAVYREIKRRFKAFIMNYKDTDTTVAGKRKPEKPVYQRAVETMINENRSSLQVQYEHLVHSEPELAYFLPEAPNEVLRAMDEGLSERLRDMYQETQMGFLERLGADFRVRVAGLPTQEEIRSLRQLHLNQLIRVTGVVSSSTGVLPQLSIVKYDCAKCGYILGPFVQRNEEETKPNICPECQSMGPFDINVEQTVYRNYQRITLQESPNTVAAGRLPRSKDVVLTGDLCDKCKPGDEIELTGIYTNSFDGSMNNRQGFPVFTTLIHANHIKREEDKTGVDAITMKEIEDERLARFVVRSHKRHHPKEMLRQQERMDENEKENEENEELEDATIPQDLFRKYISYAKQNIHPKLNDAYSDKMSKLYSDLRKESMVTGSIPITVRHMESIIRMAEAHAKIHLREYVREEDVNMAIRVMLECFISTQKFSVMRQMRRTFHKYLSYKKDNNELLLYILKQLVADQISFQRNRGLSNSNTGGVEAVSIPRIDLEEKAKFINIHNVNHFLKSDLFKKHHCAYNAKDKTITQQLL